MSVKHFNCMYLCTLGCVLVHSYGLNHPRSEGEKTNYFIDDDRD